MKRDYRGYRYHWPKGRQLTVGEALDVACSPAVLGTFLQNARAISPNAEFFTKAISADELLEVIKAGFFDPEDALNTFVKKGLLEREQIEGKKTYRMGQVFVRDGRDRYMLSRTGVASVGLINLKTGELWHWPEEVMNIHVITETEFKRVTGDPSPGSFQEEAPAFDNCVVVGENRGTGN